MNNVIPIFGPGSCCMAKHPMGFLCTKPQGHTGEHVAEGPDDEVWARWR